MGEDEWAAAKHGGRGKRGWKKIHRSVDGPGVIVAQLLTDRSVDDARAGLELIDAATGELASVTTDAAYNTVAIYDPADARGARVVVPPVKTAAVSRGRPRSTSRDRTIKEVEALGRRQWRKESRCTRQGRVENAFFRYKAIIGSRLRARHPEAQQAEVAIACNILSRVTALGRPESYAVGA